MYVIIVYDVGEKRVGKMLKLCRQYLWAITRFGTVTKIEIR